LSLKIHTSERS